MTIKVFVSMFSPLLFGERSLHHRVRCTARNLYANRGAGWCLFPSGHSMNDTQRVLFCTVLNRQVDYHPVPPGFENE